MGLGISSEDLRYGLILYILLVVCLCLRAFGQAWMAHRLGDDTPQRAGRLTLNPLPHMELIGSVVLPLICIFYVQPRLGLVFFLAWTKPVPINPANFSNPKRGLLLSQLANPLMSVFAALLSTIAAAAIYKHSPTAAIMVFRKLVTLNACLMVIDFLPIPPLPGGMLLRHFGLISEKVYFNISRWSGLLLLIAFNVPEFQGFFFRLVNLVEHPFLVLFTRLR